MLRVTNDTEKLDDIQTVADAIFKALQSINPNPEDAMMALCLVLSFVIENNIDPNQWHKAVAELHMTLASNLGKGCDCDADHGTEH